MGKLAVFFKEEWLVILFSVLFVSLYLIKLTDFPIFQDEAEFLFLSEKIIQNPTRNLFISLNQGILPVYIWAITIVAKIFNDTLFAGRLLNVLSAASIFYLYIYCRRLFGLPKRFEYYCSFLYFFSPLVLLLTRVALLDMSVMVFTAWYLFLAIGYLKTGRKKDLFFHLVFLLLAFFTKAIAVFGIPPILAAIIISVHINKKITREGKNLLLLYLFFGLSFLVFIFKWGKYFIFDSGLSLVTNLNHISIADKVKNNLWLLLHWLRAYFWPYILGVVFLLSPGKKKYSQQLCYTIIFWAVTSLLVMVVLNRYFYPRHILMVTVPLIIGTSVILIRQRYGVGLLALLLIVFLNISLFKGILLKPESSYIAKEDNFQYFEDFTSGKNIKKIADYLKQLSESGTITVWLDGTWVMEYGLRRELAGNAKVIFKSYGIDTENCFTKIVPIGEIDATTNYVLVNRTSPKTKDKLVLVKDFPVSFRLSQLLYIIN